MSIRNYRQWPVFGIVIICLYFLYGYCSANEKSKLTVSFKDQRLSVQAELTPVSLILLEIGKQTQIDIQGSELLDAKKTISFSNLPIREGLKQILDNSNYASIEESSPEGDMRIQRILIYPNSVSQKSSVPDNESEANQYVSQDDSPIQNEKLSDEYGSESLMTASSGIPLEDEITPSVNALSQSGTPLDDEIRQ